MSNEKSLLRNMLTFAVSAATLGFLFVLAVIAARYLGPADFGLFTFALAFVFFFDFLLDPGLYHLLIREIARDKPAAAQYMLHAFTWKLLAAPVVFLLIVGAAHLFQESSRGRHAVYLIAMASILKSIKDVYRASLVAHERFGLEAISAVIEKGGLLVVGGTVVAMGYGLNGLCWAFVAVRFFDLLVLRQLTRGAFHDERGRLELTFMTQMLKSGIPIGVLYLTLNIYNYVDTVMISLLRDPREVGWYSASYKIYEGSLLIPVIIGTVMLPRLSARHQTDPAQFSLLVLRVLKYSLILALLVTAVGTPLSDDFMKLIFGDAYAESAPALQILLFGVAFAYMVHFLQTVIISVNQQRVLVISAMIGLMFNIALNIIAIQKYGFVGAAWVTVLVEALVFGMLIHAMSKIVANTSPLPQMLKTVACWLIAGMPIILFLVDAPGFVQSGIWALLFVILLKVSHVVTSEEWAYVVGVFRRAC